MPYTPVAGRQGNADRGGPAHRSKSGFLARSLKALLNMRTISALSLFTIVPSSLSHSTGTVYLPAR